MKKVTFMLLAWVVLTAQTGTPTFYGNVQGGRITANPPIAQLYGGTGFGAVPQPGPLNPFLMLGDSITNGAGATTCSSGNNSNPLTYHTASAATGDCFVERIAAHYNAPFVNGGIAGSTLIDCATPANCLVGGTDAALAGSARLAAIDAFLASGVVTPAYVIVGIEELQNDASGSDANFITSNVYPAFQTVASNLQAHGILSSHIVIFTPTWHPVLGPEARAATYGAEAARFARDNGYAFVDAWSPLTLANNQATAGGTLSGDNFNPNPIGHAALASAYQNQTPLDAVVASALMRSASTMLGGPNAPMGGLAGNLTGNVTGSLSGGTVTTSGLLTVYGATGQDAADIYANGNSTTKVTWVDSAGVTHGTFAGNLTGNVTGNLVATYPSAGNAVLLGAQSDAGSTSQAALNIGVPNGTTLYPVNIGVNGTQRFTIDTNGTVVTYGSSQSTGFFRAGQLSPFGTVALGYANGTTPAVFNGGYSGSLAFNVSSAATQGFIFMVGANGTALGVGSQQPVAQISTGGAASFNGSIFIGSAPGNASGISIVPVNGLPTGACTGTYNAGTLAINYGTGGGLSGSSMAICQTSGTWRTLSI